MVTDQDQMRQLYIGPLIDASCQISSFGQVVSEKTTFSISANQKQESPIAAMFVDGTGRNEQSL